MCDKETYFTDITAIDVVCEAICLSRYGDTVEVETWKLIHYSSIVLFSKEEGMTELDWLIKFCHKRGIEPGIRTEW